MARIIRMKDLVGPRWSSIDLQTSAVFVLERAGAAIVVVTVIKLRPGQTVAARRSVATPVR